jgi:hypothetical protein
MYTGTDLKIIMTVQMATKVLAFNKTVTSLPLSQKPSWTVF